ncbi:MAG TPA: type II toxin-antitoxin system PemK/MazF family toxin [Gemmatimonadales bacterium]
MTLIPFRGQVWLVNLDPTKGHEQGGTRPCLVVSANKFNHGRAELVVVVPITTRDKGILSHVKIPQGEGGLKDDSYIKCEEVRCISKSRLERPLNSVTPETMVAVEERIELILDL